MSTNSQTPSPFLALISRLHFYVGVFIAPFIFVAAVSGVLFVITPQLENLIYAEQLSTISRGATKSLASQVAAARARVATDARVFAVRPAPEAGMTTRVMFNQPQLQGSESRAIFVDPVTLAIRGDLTVYGTSGTLPFRTWLDYLHRNLLMGQLGRNYSELAASWLWLAALGGVVLWLAARKRQMNLNKADMPARSARLRMRRWHGLIGMTIAVALVFVSATGLTWSKWAGGRIDDLRQSLGWVTPPLIISLGRSPGAPAQSTEHEGHSASGHDHTAGTAMPEADTYLDLVLTTARNAGIDSNQIEIRPPANDSQAWSVRETDRSWPTQVDAIAIDPVNMHVTSRADFESFSLVAKLIRWGIDMHMGILFGWINQVVMATVGVALSFMVVLGYMVWWRRRPAPDSPGVSLISAWSALSARGRAACAIGALALGWALPLMGLSLLAFVMVDAVRWGFALRAAR